MFTLIAALQLPWAPCVAEQIKIQHPRLTGARLEARSMVGRDEKNFDMVLDNYFTDGYVGQIYLSVRKADFKNSELVVVGLIEQKVDLTACF